MAKSTNETKLLQENGELRERIAELEETILRKEKAVLFLQESEKRYRRLFESAKDVILILDAESGKVVDVNPFLLELLGYSYTELRGKYIWEIGAFKDIAASQDAFQTLQTNEYIRYEDLPLESRTGQEVAVEFVSNVYLVDQCKVIQCNIRDITANKRAKAERKRLMAAIEQVGEAIVMTDAQGRIQFVNPAFEEITGYRQKEVVGQTASMLKSGEQDEQFYRELWQTISSGQSWSGRMVNRRKDGTLYTESATISPVLDPLGQIVNYIAVNRDISDQLSLLSQMQQAQKMEAVGLLAGGVAHDFNNMLSVIIGYTEMAQNQVDPTQPIAKYLQEIAKAAARSTDITRQLLAFARKQTIIPVILDLNQAVEGMLKMLRRLIGEDIDAAWLPEIGRCPVKMDPVQIDQILANLCLNARDAISDVGKVTIATGNVLLAPDDCASNKGCVPGEYVLLSVSDNGCGMEPETIAQIFEPFFTSKEVGRGTGLGLSTVYGIVMQNKGFIQVESHLGQGTLFKIFLPRYGEELVAPEPARAPEIPRSRGETILVVEDEPALLELSKIMLKKLGYRVLAASTPSEAIEMAANLAGQIQLLITDIIMPEMNGRDLAEQMQTLYPQLKVIFMSGYTADVIAHRGVPEEGVHFLPKPYSLGELALKIREAVQR